MTESDIRQVYSDFCAGEGGKPKDIAPQALPDGSWCFVEQVDALAGGVIVRPDKEEAFRFRGALGAVFRNTPQLGLPLSNELVLGSTEFGRYQVFDKGIAIWDGGSSLGFPLIESFTKGRLPCIVAFFDLRGFTSWSNASSTTANEVQAAICEFEKAVHSGFPVDGQPWLKLFVKSTGDGVMIVSQADWYGGDDPSQAELDFKSGHSKAFFTACERILVQGQKNLTNFPLAIGCAITAGALDRVFLFGRLDYIGIAANEAAKLQQHAWNEICITEKFRQLLIRDGQTLNGERELPPKRWRLPTLQ